MALILAKKHTLYIFSAENNHRIRDVFFYPINATYPFLDLFIFHTGSKKRGHLFRIKQVSAKNTTATERG